MGLDLDPITAVVIGCASLLGVLIIGLINNGLTLWNVRPFWIRFIQDAVLFGTLLVDSLNQKRRAGIVKLAGRCRGMSQRSGTLRREPDCLVAKACIQHCGIGLEHAVGHRHADRHDRGQPHAGADRHLEGHLRSARPGCGRLSVQQHDRPACQVLGIDALAGQVGIDPFPGLPAAAKARLLPLRLPENGAGGPGHPG